MTNKEFVTFVMDPGEVNAFLRMWDTWLKKKEKPGEPIWIKEQRYEEFMNMEFNRTAWAEACTPKAPGTVPEGFFRSTKMAFRLGARSEKEETRENKLSRKYNGTVRMHTAAVAQAEKEVPNKNKVRYTF